MTLAATSNTLPESLGEGRFAAEDFLREIQALAARFEVLRIDGPDYRHRRPVEPAAGLADDEVRDRRRRRRGDLRRLRGAGGAPAHRAPEPLRRAARRGATVGLTRVGPLMDQADALRLVVLVDRLYDRDVPVLLGGSGSAGLFSPAMLRGGYRKKYLRALSAGSAALSADARTS